MKSKFKILITLFVFILLFLNSICLASNTNYETMLISEKYDNQESTSTDSDLHITDSEYEIKNIINGNVFANTKNLTVNSSGNINGNLFVTSDNITIKSDFTYSDSQKDDQGNPTIIINEFSSISGNVFILANKFTLEPGCNINGDLYICAQEVILGQNSKIEGNVFICSDSLLLNSHINGNIYAMVEKIDMQYFTFISKDLHLSSEEANLNGWIYRNSYITSKNIITHDKFINQSEFNIKDANNLTFSGKILGNATINAKNITFKNKDNDNNLTCKITGNLSYSSNKEIEIPEGVVQKEVTYSKYTATAFKNIFSKILDYVLSLIGILILTYIAYVLVLKLSPKYLDKLSNISGLNLLIYLGIGLGFLILTPITSILLLISNVGSVLAIILLLIYLILLIISEPIFVIAVATFAKNKLPYKFNIYLYILAIAIMLSLIILIPYVGCIISVLVSLAGFGMIIRNLIPHKNK